MTDSENFVCRQVIRGATSFLPIAKDCSSDDCTAFNSRGEYEADDKYYDTDMASPIFAMLEF